MEKYKVLSPRFIYYMGIVVLVSGLFFLVFLLKRSMASEELAPVVILAIAAGALTCYFIFYLNRFIYAKVDSESQRVIYGNLFFRREISLGEVTLNGRFLYFRRIWRVKISGKPFVIHCLNDEFKLILRKG